MPLNIDLQQILLHWMNLAILTGGLYFLLYKPVKAFMDKREEHYRQLDREADEKLAEAERIKAEYQAKLDGADEEVRQMKARTQQAAQKSAEEQLAQAQKQAKQIITHAQADAEHGRERIMKEAQRELRKLAAQATKKLAFQADPFDQFLDLAEEGEEYEE